MYLVVYIYTLFLLIYISFRIFHDLIVCKVLKLVKYLLNYYYYYYYGKYLGMYVTILYDYLFFSMEFLGLLLI